MSPLTAVVDTRANSAGDAEATARCSHCHKHLPRSSFPFKTRGPGRNKERASTCQACTEKRHAQREAKKEDEDRQLPVIPLASLLDVLKGYAAGGGKDCDLEARVSLEKLSASSNDKIVKELVDRIGNALKWKWNYKHDRPLEDGRRAYIYTCAQDIKREKKSKKTAEPEKQRDKGKMARFDCKGRLNIWLQEAPGNGARSSHADITISHTGDHVPYCSVSLPEDVKRIIIDSARGAQGYGYT